MDGGRAGQTVVIFTSQRSRDDAEGYAAAAAAMDSLAAAQPGFRSAHSARDEDGFGITVSYWADEAAAIAWRDHPVHAETRARGRSGWYESFNVAVGTIARSYAWPRA